MQWAFGTTGLGEPSFIQLAWTELGETYKIRVLSGAGNEEFKQVAGR